MPRKVHVRPWRPGPRRSLTFPQKIELVIGPGRRREFSSDEERRAAWEEHRQELLDFVNLTTRPWAWWTFEAPEARDRSVDEEAQLRRLGLLRPDELEAIERWAATDARKRAGDVA